MFALFFSLMRSMERGIFIVDINIAYRSKMPHQVLDWMVKCCYCMLQHVDVKWWSAYLGTLKVICILPGCKRTCLYQFLVL
jgi:hypothetical protein